MEHKGLENGKQPGGPMKERKVSLLHNYRCRLAVL